MKIKLIIAILLCSFCAANCQEAPDYITKNNIFFLLNIHLEKRGTTKYYTSNPDMALGYERDFFGFGRHRFLGGLRTGLYKEYVLTGDGWDHPEKTRFSAGLSSSYMLYFNKYLRLQLTLMNDILFPDDYDELWSYWAVEPSFQFTLKHFYCGISASSGVFFGFEPRAQMDKAGIKVGLRF
jgi:hypothetical protein